MRFVKLVWHEWRAGVPWDGSALRRKLIEARKWLRCSAWPYLHLWLDVGFLEIGTQVLYYSLEDMTVRWVVLRVKVFRTWGFDVRLYTPEGWRR